MAKRLSHSVTIADCRVDCFTVGGHGGGGKDTSNTGVRVTHEPSGASAEGTRSRSQLANKRAAFRVMGESKLFQIWARAEAARRSGQKSVDELVGEAMADKNLRLERRNADGIWELWNGNTETK